MPQKINFREKKPIDLKLWIFKVFRSECAVCVEGYRSKDSNDAELLNWRSRAIKERFNSRTLITVSGSKYILRGPIDQDSAISLGYPHALIEQFKDGFPPDWQSILLPYYKSIKTMESLSSSRWFNATIINIVPEGLERPRQSGSTSNGLSLTYHRVADDKIEEEDEVQVEEASLNVDDDLHKNDSRELEEDIEEVEVHASAKNPSPKKLFACNTENEMDKRTVFKVPQLPSTKTLPVVHLHNWTFSFSVKELGSSTLFPNFAIVLNGFRGDIHVDWKTSCVTAVKSSRRLHTESTEYELEGPVNTQLAAQQGYPRQFISNFFDGFPDDWHTLITTFFAKHIAPVLAANVVPKVRTEEIIEKERDTNSLDDVINYDSGHESLTDEFDNDRDEKNLKTKRASGAGHASKGTGTVRVSRSGRVVKPPMASWAGQRIVYNVNGSPVKAAGIITESMMSRAATDTSAVASQMGLSPPGSPAQCENSSTKASSNSNKLRKRSIEKSSKPLVDYSMNSSSASGQSGSAFLSDSPGNPPVQKKRRVRTWHSIKSPDELGHQKKKKATTKPKNPKNVQREDGKLKKTIKKEKKTSPGYRPPSKSSRDTKRAKGGRKGNKEETIPAPSLVDVDSEVSISDVEGDDNKGGQKNEKDNDASLPDPKPVLSKPVRKRWKSEELLRLKLAVRGIMPKTEQAWEKVARVMKGGRTVEECREVAEKRLDYKVQSEDDSLKANEEIRKAAEAALKAKVGTLSYHICAERFMRKFIMGGGKSDYYESSVDLGESRLVEMPSVSEFEPNDSLLEVMRTPVHIPKGRCRGFIPQVILREESVERPTCSTYSPVADIEAERARQQRYVHYFMKNHSFMNRSSKPNATAAGRAKTNLTASNGLRPTSESNLDLDVVYGRNRNEENEEDDPDADEYFEEDS